MKRARLLSMIDVKWRRGLTSTTVWIPLAQMGGRLEGVPESFETD